MSSAISRLTGSGCHAGRLCQRAEIAVTLPQPRDRQDPAFRDLVERVYVDMTAPSPR